MGIIYYLGCLLKRHYALRHSKSLPQTVISIGNITTGGTGKTPAVIAVAEEAKRRGLFPVILTRGYKGKGNEPSFVLSEPYNGPKAQLFCSGPRDAGDEPVLMCLKLKGVPVVRSSSRYNGGLFALSNLNAFTELSGECSIYKERIVFILDDGFQHWYLKRDADIVLVDGINPFGNRRLLPFGRLREPLSALGRANIIVITREDNEQARDVIRRSNSHVPIYLGQIAAGGLINVKGNRINCNAIRGRRVFAFAGIGNPEGFRRTLLSLNPSNLYLHTFRDHHYYSTDCIDSLSKQAGSTGADIMVTTEKDMVKISGLKGTDDIYALEVSMMLEDGFYNALFEIIKGV